MIRHQSIFNFFFEGTKAHMVSLIIKLVQWRINGLSEHKFIFVAKSTMRRDAVTQQVEKPGS